MLAVDVGGTFTDVVAIENHSIKVTKVPTNPLNTEESVIAGATAVGVAGETIFNHASTAGLNAIITRRLPKIAFLTTLGHRDMLDMARTWRPLEALTDSSLLPLFREHAKAHDQSFLRRGILVRMVP